MCLKFYFYLICSHIHIRPNVPGAQFSQTVPFQTLYENKFAVHNWDIRGIVRFCQHNSRESVALSENLQRLRHSKIWTYMIYSLNDAQTCIMYVYCSCIWKVYELLNRSLLILLLGFHLLDSSVGSCITFLITLSQVAVLLTPYIMQ